MNDRTWGLMGVVLIVLTVFTVLFAMQNPAARDAVSDGVDGTSRPTNRAVSEDNDADTVVLDENETAVPTAQPTDNQGNPITVILPGVEQVMPSVTPSATASPTSSPSGSPTASPTQ